MFTLRIFAACTMAVSPQLRNQHETSNCVAHLFLGLNYWKSRSSAISWVSHYASNQTNVALIPQTLPTEEQPPRNGKRVHYQQGAQENEGIGADCSESFFGPMNTERDEYESSKPTKNRSRIPAKETRVSKRTRTKNTKRNTKLISLNGRICSTWRATTLVHTSTEFSHTAIMRHHATRRPSTYVWSKLLVANSMVIRAAGPNSTMESTLP